MKLVNASENHKISSNANKVNLLKIANDVCITINSAAEEGKFCTDYYGDIPEIVMDDLSNKSYKVEDISDDYGKKFKISW